MVYGLRLGRSRIFAALQPPIRASACFVAGEPGRRGHLRAVAGGCAAEGVVEVQTGWGRAGTCVQAAGGCGRGDGMRCPVRPAVGMNGRDTHVRKN